MAYVQTAKGTGTTTASATLTGVVAGATIVAFAWVGSNSAPTLHSVADLQGAYTARGTAVIDAVNSIWSQRYTLENANTGSHLVTFTSDIAASVDIFVVELTAPTASSTSGTNGSNQPAPGTVANALTSGSVTVSASSTLLAMSSDVSTVSVGSAPATGTGFTSRDVNADGVIGSYRLESQSVAANTAATFTAIVGSDNFVTLAIAILEPAGGGDNFYGQAVL